MSKNNRQKIPVGISSCLLGERVRYDGNHKRDRFIMDVLIRYFDFTALCPEVAVGLGVPRPVIRLEQVAGNSHAMMQTEDNRDVTDELYEYGKQVALSHAAISGYIFKSKSPSCGIERVKLYSEGVPSPTGTGIYASAVMSALPLLPVEEESRLNDPDLRDNFIERVFIYSHWQALQDSEITANELIRFHSQYKFMIMAHDQNALRELGRLVANAKTEPEQTAISYISLLMKTLKKPVTHGNRVNVLQHVAGYFKKRLDNEDREELLETLEAFRLKQLPVIVPLTLIKHHLRRNPDPFLENQAYLNSRPPE